MFITPGTPRIVIVSHTMNYGIKNSVWTALGDISANFVQMVLIVFVIGSLLEDNPEIFVYFKWAGILYVLYLAYETFTAKIKTIRSVGKVSKSIFSFYRDGFLVAGLSPKALVFFGTIFIQFINFETNVLFQFSILAITYVLLDFLTLMIYAFAAEKIATWLKGNPRILNTISACVLVLIAIIVATKI
jgi:threonine/homoserine/homoserine lactone efflux protein|tara:strand:- start:126 stop:689 length:564 start_codon:yes stop_codon:yes gene_type:complete